MALFRHRILAMEQEVRELQAAIIAVCETADSDRDQRTDVRTRLGLVERSVDEQRRVLIQTNEVIARRLTALADSNRRADPPGLKLPPPAVGPPPPPPPPPYVSAASSVGRITSNSPMPPPPPRLTSSSWDALGETRPSVTESLDYLRGLTESVVRASASQAAAVDSLRSEQRALTTRMDKLDSVIESRLENAATSVAGQVEEKLEERFESLRASQIRLANEQARHEIASRSELAAVVERFRFAQPAN